MAQTVKNLSAMQETWVRSLGQEDLEKGMATHSNILAWRIRWTEEPGRLQFMRLQRVGHNWATEQQKFILTTERKEKDWKGKVKQVKNISFFLQSWPASSLASLVLGSIVQNSRKRRKSSGKSWRARSTRLCTVDRETSPASGYARRQELIINRDVLMRAGCGIRPWVI